MPTILPGVVSDAAILSDQRIVDMDNVIAQLEDDISPLATALSRLGKRTAHNQTVTWLEDELVPRLTTLAASAAAGDGVIAVASGTGSSFRVRDVIRLSDANENCAITAITADSLGITRSIGSPAAASARTGTDVMKVGNAAAEGATIGTLLQTKKVKQTNTTQIQRDSWGFTNTALASNMYGGELDDNERQKKFIEHRRQIEQTLFFGYRDLDTSGTQPIGYAGGITDYVTTNVTTVAAGNLTQLVWEQWLRDKVFRYGSRNKVVFVTPLVRSALNSFPLGKLAINDTGPGVKKYGISLMSYVGGGTDGEVQIAVKRDWSDFNTLSGGWGGAAIACDMDNLVLRPMEGRDTKLLPKRQANDEDSVKVEYLTEYTLQLKQERTHALLKGVTAYS